jgi:D-glycero-alpha-D-manno-heptose-7-phosphate kinase
MIISRTPFRISFFGGGTDYPAWVEKHGGAVLSTTFDKYNYITCRILPPFFTHRHRVSYSVVEDVADVKDIRHPAIRAVLSDYLDGEGVELHCDADLPARSGLGSGSSFMVGLLHVLEALKSRQATPERLAREAIRYEQEVLGDNVGYQDQVAAAFGGLNVIHFSPGGEFRVDSLIVPKERKVALCRCLMLFFTGFTRSASAIAASQVQRMEENNGRLERIRGMVDDAVDILVSDSDLRCFGELLHEAWRCKRELSDKVSTEAIDAVYDRARKAGAVGGKLLGAGGGGFMLFFAEPDKRESVRAALHDLIHVPFEFENSGSRIVYYRV